MGLLRLIAVVMTVAVVAGTASIAVAYLLFVRAIDDDLARLLAQARSPGRVVSEAMLAALPPSAQRYFRHAGIVGQPIPKLIRLSQSGRIRGSATASWMNFEAQQTYSTSPPSFLWRAWLPARLAPVALGRDEYLDAKGSILIKLLGLVPVADEHGDALAAAGLMRYLNESMWFPAALFAPGVTISAVDVNSFRVTLTDGGFSAEAVFFVDADGRLVNFRADRFNTSTHRIETWETPVAGYRAINGLSLPTSGSAVWRQKDGDLTYIELEVTCLTYE